MKQLGEVESSVRQLQEVGEPAPENGIAETLIEVPKRDDFEWAWLLWGNRRLLWRFVWRGVIVAIVIAFVIPPQYKSTTRLMPAENNSGGGLPMMAALVGGSSNITGGSGGISSLLGGSALGGAAGELLGAKDPGALWSDILASETVQDRLIERFDLRKVYDVPYMDAARSKLTKYTDVTVDKKSGVITIEVEARDRQRAQLMAQAYIEELDHTLALVSTSSARRERIFLEQRLQQVKQNLDQASSQLAQYASKNTVIDVDSQTKAMVEGAAALQGELIAAQSELDGLEQIYTANNVRVRSLRARVDELRSELQKMGSAGIGVNASGAAVSSSDSDQLYPSIRKLPLLGVRWLDLYREGKIQETVYELLTQQFEIAKVEEAKETPTVKVIDPPDWPERKSSPHRTLIVLLGMLLSFFGGVVWVLQTASWQQMDPQNPRKQLALEIASRCNAAWSRWAERFPVIRRTEAWWKRRKASSAGLK